MTRSEDVNSARPAAELAIGPGTIQVTVLIVHGDGSSSIEDIGCCGVSGPFSYPSGLLFNLGRAER